MKQVHKLISTALVLALLVFAPLASADDIGDFIGNGTTGGSSALAVKRLGGVGVQSIGRLISAVFNVAILVAAIAVFGMLILGGYGWLTAGGDKGKVEEA